MTYLVIVLLKKITTIGNPYTKLKSARVQYAAKPRYANQMFTNLLFCPKQRFLSKNSFKKKERENDLHFVISLADISAIFNNRYTEFVLLDTNHPA
jgi:hypothetical protein